MIRLATTLVSAALVVWAVGQAAEHLSPEVKRPAAEAARKLVAQVSELAELESILDPDPAAAPLPEHAGDSMPEPVAPLPESRREPSEPVLERKSVAREPFVPDPAPPSKDFLATETTGLDRERSDRILGRLDRVMALAAGRGD